MEMKTFTFPRMRGTQPIPVPIAEHSLLQAAPRAIAALLRALEARLGQLLTSPIIRFDEGCRRNLPESPGVYRIFDPGQPDETVRAGRTDASLRQRVYQNHLMGNQSGNLPAQLVRSGVCVDLNSAKQFMR
jgi:hypothetical protein